MRTGWSAKTLDQIGRAQTGSTPCTSEKRNFGDFIPFINPSDFNADGSLRYNNGGLSEVGLQKSRRIAAGSVLMVCIGATIGKCGICDRTVVANQQINSLTPFEGVAHKFLYYQMITPEFQRRVLLDASQATLPIISKSKWINLTVVLPPSLEEQQRIVAILDKAFGDIITARASAEMNLQSARELFESYLHAVFVNRDEWQTIPIGEVAMVFDGPHATPRTVEAGPVFLGISALQDGKINLGETRHVTPDDFQRWTRRVKPQTEDIVFSYETRLGQIAIIPDGLECCLGRRMGLIRVDRSRLNSRFFVYQYLSRQFREFLESKVVRGATVDRLALRDFPSFPITVPPLTEQEQVVDRLDALRTETQRLESIYRRKLAALDELKQSLLHQAFSGAL